MMATKKPLTVFLVLVLAAAVDPVGLFAQQPAPQANMGADKIEGILRDISGSIEIWGTIVDQDGNPLQGVSVEVSEERVAEMFEPVTPPTNTIVDHRFQIEKSNVVAIDCLFFKAGYYAERWSFSFPGAGSEPNGRVFAKRDVEIVLREKPDSAPLQKFEGILRSDVGGPTSVLDTQRPDRSIPPFTTDERPGSDRMNLARPHFFLDPAVGSDGRLESVLIEIEGFAGPQVILKEGWIGYSQLGPGDGFIEADIPETSSRIAKGFRWMTEAPATGYASRLQLAAEVGKKSRFFYCRIGGRFGKGVVTNMPRIVTNERIESASAIMIVYFNPSGSRDLSYSHP